MSFSRRQILNTSTLAVMPLSCPAVATEGDPAVAAGRRWQELNAVALDAGAAFSRAEDAFFASRRAGTPDPRLARARDATAETAERTLAAADLALAALAATVPTTLPGIVSLLAAAREVGGGNDERLSAALDNAVLGLERVGARS